MFSTEADRGVSSVRSDPGTKECMGHAFVDFVTPADAAKAMKLLAGSRFKGARIRVDLSSGTCFLKSC
jgi:RNA recognition motif-containing protein